METLFFIICSGFFGYIYQKLEKLESKIDILELEVARIAMRNSRRSTDTD